MKKSILLLLFVLTVNTASYSQCWSSISAGYSHMLAIAGNGTLWAWGKNTHGELGDGTNVNKNLPVQIGTDTHWKEVSTGMAGIYAHTLAVKTDGTLWAWGSNTNGQLGDGTLIDKNYPVQIGTDTNWKTVTAGFNHSIAIKNNGTLWGWGTSSSFALIGFPSGLDVLAPEQRNTETNWVKASAGDRVTLAIKTNATVWGWGYNQGNMLTVFTGTNVQYPTQRQYNGTNVRNTSAGLAVSYDVLTNNVLTHSGDIVGGTNPVYVKDADAGRYTVISIKPNNTLWYMGKMMGGTTQIDYPMTQLGTANNWTKVSLGDQIAAGIDSNGDLWTWGWNYHGELGVGTNGVGVDSTVPLLVACPTGALSTIDYGSQVTLKLFPNPAQDFVTITSNVSIDRLVIVDVLGKELQSQNSNVKVLTVDVSQFSKGLYFFEIFSGTQQKQIKFIKN